MRNIATEASTQIEKCWTREVLGIATRGMMAIKINPIMVMALLLVQAGSSGV
jgi:hypothetical protein